ncbi:MAG: DUF2285 domain-containing protein [Rhizobiaceae bacterium]|nr:DUF2285 domain-containing protein [Rhizobiaceae bacterium]
MLEAHVFWTDETYRRVVTAHVSNRVDSTSVGVISLGKFRCRKTLLKTVNGEQYLLLADQHRIAQVKCIGDSINISPFLIEPIIDRFPEVEGTHRLIRNLVNLYRDRNFGAPNAGWTSEGLRHRDALAAFDCRANGYSYREIAIFIYGESKTAGAWSSPDQTLKNRVIRSVKRGERMVAGHFRSLLK